MNVQKMTTEDLKDFIDFANGSEGDCKSPDEHRALAESVRSATNELSKRGVEYP